MLVVAHTLMYGLRIEESVNLLGMFAKYWEPGRVKTRLGRSIGLQAAAEVYRAFIAAQLHRLRCTADQRVIVYTPGDRREQFQHLAVNHWQLKPQADGNLGARMQRFFSDAFAAGAARVVVIGSDSPTIPLDILDQAFDQLQRAAVVLGPSADGGYYLIGMREECPKLFDSIAWGSRHVWQQTIRELERQRMPFVCLPPWYDVDELEDLRRLSRELQLLSQDDSSWLELAELVQPYAAEDDFRAG